MSLMCSTRQFAGNNKTTVLKPKTNFSTIRDLVLVTLTCLLSPQYGTDWGGTAGEQEVECNHPELIAGVRQQASHCDRRASGSHSRNGRIPF